MGVGPVEHPGCGVDAPSREIVMGEGVRPTAVVRCETTRWYCCGGVGSSSVSDVSTFISLSSLELLVLVELAMSRVLRKGDTPLEGRTKSGSHLPSLRNQMKLVSRLR